MQFLIQKNTCLGRFLELFMGKESIPLASIVKKLPRSSFYSLIEKHLAELNQLVKEKAGHEVIIKKQAKKNGRLILQKHPYVEIRNGENMIEVNVKR